MSTTTIVIIAVVAGLIVLAGAVLAMLRSRNRRRLQERFGPEYERTVSATESPKRAAAELRAREDERDKLAITSLSSAQRDRYAQDWRQIQSEFVDVPARSLTRADELIADVMTDRGYPLDDFDRQADLISVDHPTVVENYRRAHRTYLATQAGHSSTEEQREGFVAYRSLFEELLEGDGPDNTHRSTDTPTAASA